MQRTEIRCIYTNALISAADISLDHYLPRSFVAHDQIWNLAPISRALNSTKGPKIPDDRFIPAIADLHFQVIGAFENLPECKGDIFEQYVSGLCIDQHDLASADRLQEAFRETLLPLKTIAMRMGFPHGWRAEGL